ncbi:MAG: GTPase ObgE [Myxococcales bacterium]|nr:GTPase ObgE [Myxococcales bacterium]
MRFVDEVTLEVVAGDGGDGSAAMRREKYRPLGGPAGGDGGRGGSVFFEADERLTTLMDLEYRRVIRAESGEHGRGRDQYGKGGDDQVVRVPIGTQIYDAASGELVADLERPGQRECLAKGGRGGRGNIHFATPQERAPSRAESGRPGGRRMLRLELKLLADVGIVGFPNVGKSTFITAVSKARPKVADYPFTTLRPNLGVVSRGEFRSFVLADIPGIIEGAADGAGLGHRFLKHIERTRVLLFLVSMDPDPEREPLGDLLTLERELERFDQALAARPRVVALSKLDLPEVREALPGLRDELASRGIELRACSAATTEGIAEVLDALEAELAKHPLAPTPRRVPLPTAADRPHGPPEAD